jgi:hypothetical protein
MRVRRIDAIERDLRKLRKYRSVPKALEQFERLLAADSREGHVPYSGLHLQRGARSARIFKARVICAELGGKSSGLRYVYEQLVGDDGEDYMICLHVYSHQSAVNEQQVQNLVRERFGTYDAQDLEELDDPLS